MIATTIDQVAVGAAVRQAAARGYAVVNGFLDAPTRELLRAEAAVQEYEPLEPIVGRVHQGGMVARVGPSDPIRPHLRALAAAMQSAVYRSGVPGTERFSPNEAMYQRYSGGSDGITAHRDQSFYRLAVLVMTLEGSAPFAILDKVTQEVVEEWVTEPGDLYVLAGGGLTSKDIRPLHSVGAPIDGTRLSLTLRMKRRGSG